VVGPGGDGDGGGGDGDGGDGGGDGGPGGVGGVGEPPVAAASSLVKIGVPRPVAGSQPVVQANPAGTLIPSRPMALVPLTMSVKASLFW